MDKFFKMGSMLRTFLEWDEIMMKIQRTGKYSVAQMRIVRRHRTSIASAEWYYEQLLKGVDPESLLEKTLLDGEVY